jgi:hypothetical protein
MPPKWLPLFFMGAGVLLALSWQFSIPEWGHRLAFTAFLGAATWYSWRRRRLAQERDR